MKILLTGGTGFLGRRLIDHLLPRHDVRALVRPTSDRSGFPETVELVEGDVTYVPSLERAAEGCAVIIHAAALVKIMAPSEQFDEVNVEGLANVLTAASRHGFGEQEDGSQGIQKIVYVSSFMALGPTEHGRDRQLDETATPDNRVWINDYERTKTLSDRMARQAIDDGVPLNIVYPGVIYGPGVMTEGNIVVRHILDLAHRRLPALLGKPERIWNYSYVEDVADGIVRTLEQAPIGERFVIAGDNVTQEEFYDVVRRVFEIKVPSMRMPKALAMMSGALMKAWALVTGTTPKLTPDLVEIYTHDWAYSSKKAKRELDYSPRSLEAGLSETCGWLTKQPDWPQAVQQTRSRR